MPIQRITFYNFDLLQNAWPGIAFLNSFKYKYEMNLQTTNKLSQIGLSIGNQARTSQIAYLLLLKIVLLGL